MKTLLLFGAIALSINVFGQNIKTVKIGNLEVMKKDLGEMDWYDAKKACAELGDGWRLPTKNELSFLYENKAKIGGFSDSYYWSSTEADSDGAWIQYFSDGFQANFTLNTEGFVRAIRPL
tara:strand:+ start:166 stop:525 length:360 start_codon:yes stop_codon:yes gene_type:complete